MAPQDETKQIIFLAHQLADLVPELLKLSTRHFKASRILVNTDILNDYAEIGSAFATIASTGKTLSAAILANEYTALTSDFASDLSRFVQVLEQIRGSAELDGFAKREGGEGRALRPAVIEESFRVVRHARSMAASVRLFTGVLEFGKALACPDSVDEMVRRTATNSILAAGNALREVKFLLEPGRFGPWRPYLIMKRHGDVDKWLSSLLLPKELDEPKEVAADSDTSPPSSSASSEADTESIDIPVRNRVFFDRDNDFGSIPPPPPGSRLDQTPFIKVHKDYVDQRTLEYFNTDYAVKKDQPEYYVIWTNDRRMFDPEFLFDHTRKLRIDDKLSSIDAKKLLKWLLARWTSVEIPDVALKQLEQDEVEDSSFERDVNDFKKDEEDETNRFRSRRVVIERNRSLSPERRANDLLPPICRGRRLGRFPPSQGVADHWKPFHFRPDNLLQSLSQHGWKPVYMRGNASGQTWFCGALPVHVRRFKEDYTPQDTAWDPKKNPGEQAYLIVGPEWVEEAELQRLGFSYKALPSGHFSLDPRLASHDVLCLVDATAVMREERLYRKYRTLPGGDLFEPSSISVPDVDFLHGGLGLGSGSASHMHEGSGLHNAGKFVPSEEKVRHRFEDMSMMGARISELGGDMSAPEMAPETTPSEQTYMSEPFVEVSK